ncbi:MAG TPA: hypothetical protein VK208_17990, partial [Pyrinomonadaceae bacterium]|nr:hypothetical protein [Pyrinomonadaceae bacterium]
HIRSGSDKNRPNIQAGPSNRLGRKIVGARHALPWRMTGYYSSDEEEIRPSLYVASETDRFRSRF